MAESFTPITQQNPGAAAGVGNNPFTAQFWAQVNALNLSTAREMAREQQATRQTNAAYEYNRGVNARAEPQRLTANRNTANTQGLAESGVLANRQGQTQTGYAQKGARLNETRANAVKRFQTNEKGITEKYGADIGVALAAQQEKGVPTAEAEGAQPTTPGPAPTPGVPQPGAAGNLGKWTNVPGGSVRINNAQGPRIISGQRQPTTLSPRKAAARRAVG